MDFEQINTTIREQTKACNQRLKDRIQALNMKHVSSHENFEPLGNIKNQFSNQAGIINRIRFKFKKSGIFVHKGVGRGGTKNRTPKEWFNPVIEDFADKLSNELADLEVSVIFDKLKIK